MVRGAMSLFEKHESGETALISNSCEGSCHDGKGNVDERSVFAASGIVGVRQIAIGWIYYVCIISLFRIRIDP